MSTGAQILVEGNEAVKIYRHSDGYPYGVMPILEPIVRYMERERGHDPEYLAARILGAFLIQEEQERLKKLSTDPQRRFFCKPACTGYGLDSEFHGDIEYLYWVRKGGTIECYHVNTVGGSPLPWPQLGFGERVYGKWGEEWMLEAYRQQCARYGLEPGTMEF